MNYDLGYWNIKKLLPYQRNFNLVNSIRSTGKTYTCAGFLVERFLKKREQFIIVVRNQNEKTNGALRQWFSKVMLMEYPELPYHCTSDTMYYAPTDEKKDWIVMGHCRALTETIKVKKQSFPLVRWMVMDEYMLEPKHFSMYVKGWNEPDLLLNMYHSIDREQDKVICFLLGNNTTWYNPYHMHDAFKIPKVEKGGIWMSENVLFQMYEPPAEFYLIKSKSKFIKMMEGTNYGDYAVKGNYSDDETFIKQRTRRSTYSFAFAYDTDIFGVWCDSTNRFVYISDAFNPSTFIFRVDGKPVEGHYMMQKDSWIKKWLAKSFGNNLIYYESMEIKVKAEKIIMERIIK